MGPSAKPGRLDVEIFFGLVYVFFVTMILIGLSVGAFALIGF